MLLVRAWQPKLPQVRFCKNLIRNLLYGALGAARNSQKLGFVMNLLRNLLSGAQGVPRSKINEFDNRQDKTRQDKTRRICQATPIQDPVIDLGLAWLGSASLGWVM